MKLVQGTDMSFSVLSAYLGWFISRCCFTSCSTAALQGTTALYIIFSTASKMSYKESNQQNNDQLSVTPLMYIGYRRSEST